MTKSSKGKHRKALRSAQAVIDRICDDQMKAEIQARIKQATNGIIVDVSDEFELLRKRARKALPLVRDTINGAKKAAVARNEHVGKMAIQWALFGGKKGK